MLKKLFIAFFLALSISAATTIKAEDNAWLVGIWQLDSSSKTEYLEFSQNRVTLISERGRKISGHYRLTDNAVKIVYKFKGKKIPVELSYAAGKNVLKGNLANTGKSVKYTKSG